MNCLPALKEIYLIIRVKNFFFQNFPKATTAHEHVPSIWQLNNRLLWQRDIMAGICRLCYIFITILSYISTESHSLRTFSNDDIKMYR